MKLFLITIILSFINVFLVLGQSGWRADLRVENEFYIGGLGNKEANVSMITDLFYNGRLILPQSNYKYSFFKRYILEPNPDWIEFKSSPKWGINTQGTHVYQDSTWLPVGKFEVYCKITLPDNTIVTSDIITIPWYGTSIDQKNSNDNSFGSVSYWYKNSFKVNNGLNTIYIPRYDAKVLQAETNVVLNPQEKYHSWKDNNGGHIEYNNFIRFYPNDYLTNSWTSYFQKTVGATIRTKVDDLYLDVIKFKDPWLRDYNEAPFGLRNQGLNALSQPLANTDNNLAITSEHQGVLLNQNPNFLSNIPYYSINIPSSIYLSQTGKTHNVYLQNWSVTGATLQYPNALTTGVVFTSSSGATVTANVKATQLSNNSNAFANNSQRKLIKTPDGVMHLTYESMGRVFYETSTDNGTTWQLMNGGKPLDNGAGKCPSIDYCYNEIAIVYQQKNGDYSTLQLKAFIASGNQYIYNFNTTLTTSVGLYSSDANPAFAWSSSDKMIVVWQNSASLIYISAILGVNPY